MKSLLLFLLLLPCLLHALTPGSPPPAVTLSGDSGGRTDNTPWSSAELMGKVYCLLYVDPDERDLNKPFFDSLKKAAFPYTEYGFVAVLNLKATVLPNFILEPMLRKNQKKHPQAVYVRDREKALVEKWGLSDDNSDVLIFNRQGKLIFRRDGELVPGEIDQALSLIRRNLGR